MIVILGSIIGAAVLLVIISMVAKIELKGLLIGTIIGAAAMGGVLGYFTPSKMELELEGVVEKSRLVAAEAEANRAADTENAAPDTGAIDVEVVTSTITTASENNLNNNCPAYAQEWTVAELGGATIDQNVATEFCGCVKAEARSDANLAQEISDAGDKIPSPDQTSDKMNATIATCMQHSAGG